MKIGIDANEANVENKVGSGQYAHNILKHWQSQKKHKFHLYLKSQPNNSLPKQSKNWQYHVVKPKKFWLRLSLPLNFLLKKPDLDVFFSPAHYAPNSVPSPLVLTIHDLAYEYFPNQFLRKDLYKLKNWTRSAVKKADKLIAVSENTKNDLQKLYDIPEEKITVVYNGYDKNLFHKDVTPSSEVLAKYKIPNENFLLYLGTIQPRKNLLHLVQAFHLLKEKGEYKGKLVLAGGKGWMSEDIIEKINQSKHKKDILFPGYVSQKDLPVLYKTADLYILPSLYEGFGIPALEAMACGTPVVVSNNSSLPEVVGDAGVLFDPKDPEDISQKILTSLSKKKELSKKGLAQAAKFSWRKTAQKTLKVLQEEASKSV